jgi:excisionase family DNA binding protein
MELFTVAEAARETRMSSAWWRQRIFRKEITFLKIGRNVRIPRSTVEEVLAKSVVEPRKKCDD